jgi:hypothetical protein
MEVRYKRFVRGKLARGRRTCEKRHTVNVMCLHDGTLYLCGFAGLMGETVVARKSLDMLVLRAKRDPEMFDVRPLAFDGMKTRDKETINYFIDEKAVGRYFVELPGREYVKLGSDDLVHLTPAEIEDFGF